MENKIIKIARFAINLNNSEYEIKDATSYYAALEKYITENPNSDIANNYYELINITGAMNFIISRISIELAINDFCNNGITEKEMMYFNKIQKEYQNIKEIFIEMANQSERLAK